jgi:hypothetical protein
VTYLQYRERSQELHQERIERWSKVFLIATLVIVGILVYRYAKAVDTYQKQTSAQLSIIQGTLTGEYIHEN